MKMLKKIVIVLAITGSCAVEAMDRVRYQPVSQDSDSDDYDLGSVSMEKSPIEPKAKEGLRRRFGKWVDEYKAGRHNKTTVRYQPLVNQDSGDNASLDGVLTENIEPVVVDAHSAAERSQSLGIDVVSRDNSSSIVGSLGAESIAQPEPQDFYTQEQLESWERDAYRVYPVPTGETRIEIWAGHSGDFAPMRVRDLVYEAAWARSRWVLAQQWYSIQKHFDKIKLIEIPSESSSLGQYRRDVVYVVNNLLSYIIHIGVERGACESNDRPWEYKFFYFTKLTRDPVLRLIVFQKVNDVIALRNEILHDLLSMKKSFFGGYKSSNNEAFKQAINNKEEALRRLCHELLNLVRTKDEQDKNELDRLEFGRECSR